MEKISNVQAKDMTEEERTDAFRLIKKEFEKEDGDFATARHNATMILLPFAAYLRCFFFKSFIEHHDDFISCGMIAVYEVLERYRHQEDYKPLNPDASASIYDPEISAPRKYFSRHIIGAMREQANFLTNSTRHNTQEWKSIRSAQEKLHFEGVKEISDAMLAEEMGVTTEKIQNIRAKLESTKHVPMYSTYEDGGREEQINDKALWVDSAEDQIFNISSDYCKKLISGEVHARLTEEEESFILKCFFSGDKVNIRKTSREMGFSIEHGYYLYRRAINKLSRSELLLELARETIPKLKKQYWDERKTLGTISSIGAPVAVTKKQEGILNALANDEDVIFF